METLEDLSNPRKRQRMDVDWSQLQRDILVRIVENHMQSFDDFTVFSCVCRPWYDAASACDLVKLRDIWSRQMPWLMLSDGNHEIFSKDDVKVECYAPEELDNQETMTTWLMLSDGNHEIFSKDDVKVECYAPEELDNQETCDEKVENMKDATIGCDDLYRRKVLDLRRNKTYDIPCPEGYRKVCWGSALGWIVAAGLDHKMYMFNPLTKSQLSLPSRKTFPYLWKEEDETVFKYFLNKVVVLKVPNYDHIVSGGHGFSHKAETLLVVAFYGYGYGYGEWDPLKREGDGHIAIAKPGDTRWKPLQWSSSNNDKPDLQDVIYHNDLGLLFVCQCAGLVVCNLWDKEQSPFLEWYLPRVSFMEGIKRYHDMRTYIFKFGNDYFVASKGATMHGWWRKNNVIYNGGGTFYQKSHFLCVFKFDLCAKSLEELEELPQDVAIFVGNNTTMAVSASETGCQDKCVYFTDDFGRYSHFIEDKLGGEDSGLLINYVVKPINFHMLEFMRSSYCCPFWFRPFL